eukprot:TRINITY_DN33542_c0_g1_i1.p1 TRINITY_DN33542_c0_g1~~TRINITY_DN33542_c0_g1_i1.p1  ORF type:complete len:160 (+),score=60.01 TRINITY_DN33542_c0_g1_i1:57-536(+)
MPGLFDGHKLQRKNGDLVDAGEALKGKKVALYFSAEWCGDCTPITGMLATLYEMVNEDEKELEIVWVSADEDEEQMYRYSKKHADYLMIPYGSVLRQQLPAMYGVFGGRHVGRYPGVERKSGIPGLVVINEAGDVLVFDGVRDVENKHGDAAKNWPRFN